MYHWRDFAAQDGIIAEEGLGLLFQHGIGLAYLATVDDDNAPRIHPIVVVYSNGGLFTFLIPSPKRRDLERNPHYALHAYSSADSDNEFALRGTAQLIEDEAIRQKVISAAVHDIDDDHFLYELFVDSALSAEYEYRGQWPPSYATWTSKGDAAPE